MLADNIRIILAREKIDYAAGHGEQTTFKDMGYDFEVPLLVMIQAPKGLPEPVAKKLQKAFMDGMNSDIVKKVAADQELAVKPMTGNGFVDYLKKLSATNEELIREVGMYKTPRNKCCKRESLFITSQYRQPFPLRERGRRGDEPNAIV